MRVTAEQFEKATGRPPQDDDLDRCNCPNAGEIGHLLCGWDDHLNLPAFEAVALGKAMRRL